jgi:UDP-N-acetylenolpyruvoylglucosamine reductase
LARGKAEVQVSECQALINEESAHLHDCRTLPQHDAFVKDR